MRSKKTYVILIIIIIAFALFMYFLVGKKNLKEESEVSTIIVGDTSIWNYSNRKWINVKKQSTIDKLNWEKFKLYDDNKYLGKYSAWYDTTKWYYFDNNKDAIETSGKVLAYKANYELNVEDYKEEEIEDTDKEVVNYVLDDNDLSTSAKFTSNYKVNIDFDHDNNVETFYVLTNAFPTEFVPDKIFSIVFMVKNDEIYYLYKDVDNNKINNGCKPYFNYFFDLNNDKVDELILSCGRYSDTGTVDMLYKLVKNEFKIQISNQ